MSDSGLTSSINYELLVEDSLRTVVRGALAIVQEYGLPGECHFYITFRTQAPGVEMDEELKSGNPHEMTIVLQHQFWDLTVEEKQFSVGLSFSGVQHNLVIPFSAITHFTDPSVGFGLQFSDPNDNQKTLDDGAEEKPVLLRDVSADDGTKTSADNKPSSGTKQTKDTTAQTDDPENEPDDKGPAGSAETESAEIVSLDRFRKDPAPKS